MENNMVASEVTEQIVSLNEQERAELRKTNRNYWAAMVGIVACTAFFLAASVRSFRVIRGWDIFLIAFLGIVAGVALLLCYAFKSLVAKDLKANQKKIITGPIEEKRMGASRNRNTIDGTREPSVTMSFRLTLNGKEYFAPDDIYLSLRKGDFVELHILPNSKKILRWNILKNQSVN